MTTTDIIEYFKENSELVDHFLEEKLVFSESPTLLTNALRYGVIGGGKKLRASLLFATAEGYGVSRQDLLPLAAGIEMIHSFSLVHDDLPSMDNDDFRRGKHSLHKAYGEAMGILAGDALLVEGLKIFVSDPFFPTTLGSRKTVRFLDVLLGSLGAEGMVGGQVLDVESEGKSVTMEDVYRIYRMKTARFIQAPILCGAIAGGAPEEEQEKFRTFGILLGECFQMKDDILDVTGESRTLGKTAGKDFEQEKATLIKVVGLDESLRLMNETFVQAESVLQSIGRPFSVLDEIARFAISRDH
ncbi:MAG: polyprenyl synthetase family protein [Candidatus Atribacteria bacterium]|nr:polyprenyl synthetase family protein [Candidatus Atribacteria bacterium]